MSEWQPIDTIPEERPVLILWDSGDSTVWKIEEHPNIGGAPSIGTVMATNWAPLPTMPAPDPMTVAAWHEGTPPMDAYWVSPNTYKPTVIYDRLTTGKDRWCALGPLLARLDHKAEQ
jgi:hypothetical protein